MKLPWTKFYWTDYAGDPALRLCSLAAQGLWMRMLCVAADHNPIGYVAVNGRGLDETDLAQLTGVSESEVKTLLAQLDRNGVFSRDRQGRIYNRRMVDDAKKSAINKKHGKMGGNPTLSKQTDFSQGDNPRDNPEDKTQKPEARGQKEIDQDFDVWYAAYPSKIGKGQAIKAYRTARGKTDALTLLSSLASYQKNKPSYAAWAHPATWLNGERWLDQSPSDVAPPVDAPGQYDAIKRRYAEAAQ